MKRGLRLAEAVKVSLDDHEGPNTGPDEEGVETFAFPEEAVCPPGGPNTGPDEEGVETFIRISALPEFGESEYRPR